MSREEQDQGERKKKAINYQNNMEKKLRTHKDLEVWKNSVLFVTDVYKITKSFPSSEIYGLTNQIRRASVSIPSNIAEGSARNSDKEYIQFLYISLGSLSEVETQFIISFNLGFINDMVLTEVTEKLLMIKAQLMGLIKYLKGRASE
ncbi:MAG: four helix bundle protein [Ignavibacteria bacterium]